MELLSMPVTLVIKAPNQKIADYTVECALNWTVRKLKEHLASVYPNKPLENQQRIIYSGRLLNDDELTLKDVLRQYEPNQTIHTVHLVCSPTTESNYHSPAPPTTTSMPVAATNVVSSSTAEGLRHRTPASSQSSSTSVSSDSLPPSSVSAGTAPVSTPSPYSQPQFTYGGQYPAQYNPYGQLNPAAFGGAPPGVMPAGVMMPPDAMGVGAAYNVYQMLWMQQQAYAQYTAQYMQYYQQNGQPLTPPTMSDASSPQVAPLPPNQNGPAAAQMGPEVAVAAPPVAAGARPGGAAANPAAVRMNAQGGAVVDDEDEDPNRDWLDWVYTFIRFMMLLCILYFYSTLPRFLATLTFVVVIYLYQAGWFKAARRGREAPQPPVQQAAVPPREQVHPTPAPEAAEEEDGVQSPVPELPRQPGTLTIAWNFFITFFSSLAPQQPPAVMAN